MTLRKPFPHSSRPTPADLAPPGRACLLLYGREAYGEEWYEAARGAMKSGRILETSNEKFSA